MNSVGEADRQHAKGQAPRKSGEAECRGALHPGLCFPEEGLGFHKGQRPAEALRAVWVLPPTSASTLPGWREIMIPISPGGTKQVEWPKDHPASSARALRSQSPCLLASGSQGGYPKGRFGAPALPELTLPPLPSKRERRMFSITEFICMQRSWILHSVYVLCSVVYRCLCHDLHEGVGSADTTRHQCLQNVNLLQGGGAGEGGSLVGGQERGGVRVHQTSLCKSFRKCALNCNQKGTH